MITAILKGDLRPDAAFNSSFFRNGMETSNAAALRSTCWEEEEEEEMIVVVVVVVVKPSYPLGITTVGVNASWSARVGMCVGRENRRGKRELGRKGTS